MPNPSTADRPPILLPWGQGPALPIEIPPTWEVADVVWPDLAHPIDNYPATLAKALEEPAGGSRIEAMVRAGSKVAIVVDDPSRWTPVREAIPVVLGKLASLGLRSEDVTISVGVGRHHAVDAESMRLRVGDAVVDAHQCFSPPVDDLSAYEDLGTTPEGVPVRVFRPVANADLRILIGSVLPHLQAGFGGGYKLIFPGTSHRTTLSALHRKGLGGDDAGRLLGSDAGENPMRRCSDRAFRSATCSDRPARCFTSPPAIPTLSRMASRPRLASGSGLRRSTRARSTSWSPATPPGRATR